MSQDTVRNTVSFEAFGAKPLTDAEFVVAINDLMPPGLRIMNANCESASRELGEVVVRYELDEQFTNVAGFICGGYIAQMLDQAATAAASLTTGMAAPSINLQVSFVAAARPDSFAVTGLSVQAGRSLAFTEARAYDSRRRLIATGSVTSQLIAPSKLSTKSRT